MTDTTLTEQEREDARDLELLSTLKLQLEESDDPADHPYTEALDRAIMRLFP